MTLIKLENLQLTLGGHHILKGIDCLVGHGDFQIIIGPNGAGKSSILKCILSLFPRYRGRILFNDRCNSELTSRERARLVAYVPQFLDLQFNLDVYSFMELARYAHDEETLAVREEIIDSSLNQTGTHHLKYAYLDELSGGERQRVMIASALAQQPKLLILDEPSQSLDPEHRVDLVRLLERLYRTQALTVILVTHDWNEFMHLQPNVLAVKEGRVAFTCAAANLSTHLDSLFGCGFHHLTVEGRTYSIPKF